MAVLLAGCSFLPGRQFVFGFPARDDIPELRGVLTDTTGSVAKVTTIERMNPVPQIDRGMLTFDDDHTSLIAFWMDACDASVEIAVTPEGGTTVDVRRKPTGDACDLVGIRRYVRIQFAAPLDLSRTTITFTP